MVVKKQRINRFTYAELDIIILALTDHFNIRLMTTTETLTCKRALSKAKKRRHHP